MEFFFSAWPVYLRVFHWGIGHDLYIGLGVENLEIMAFSKLTSICQCPKRLIALSMLHHLHLND